MSTRRSSRLQGIQPPEEPPLKEEPKPKKSNTKSKKQKSPSPTSPKSSNKSRKQKSPEASASAASASAASASAASASAASASAASAASAATASNVFHFMHNCHDRLLITVPVNDTNLWPTPNAPFFRSTGTSNDGHGIFKDTWFPFVSMKNAKTMPNYLKSQLHGFLIKSSFLINASDQVLTIRPNWLFDILHDYPIPMDNTKLAFLNKIGKTPTFKDVYIFITKYTGTEPIYYDIVRLVLDEVDTCFVKFLNYFSYPWQVMVSWNIGTGYWTLNRNLYNYIGTKLREHDIIRITPPIVGAPVPCTDITYENVAEAIRFLENNNAQMNMAQIHALSDKENASVGKVKGGLNLFIRDKFTSIINRLDDIKTRANLVLKK